MNIQKHGGALFVVVLLVTGVALAQGRPGYQPDNSVRTLPGIPARPSSSQDPFLGSVPTGSATAENLPLSLADAIARGLRQNLGLLVGSDAVLATQGALWQERSKLLPNFSASLSENASQTNLAALGIRLPGAPTIVGPYGFVDARARVSAPLLDFYELNTNRAAAKNLAAEKLSYQDARETVVLVVAATYLQAIAAQARVATAGAQVQTAQALYDQALDQKNAGLSAGIDLLRAQVELQTQQQQLIAVRNDFDKQKLALARIIGLPLAQQFMLTDTAPYEASAPVTVEGELAQAYASRADFQSALTRVEAAESTRRAATAEHLPSLVGSADYGLIGPAPAQTHGTFNVSAALRIPIFAGGKAHGDALVAQAALDRSRHELEDLRAGIEQEMRIALLDLQSASDQVAVARSTQDLAQQTLVQARDRFQAGVTDNIDVVQAQEAIVGANEAYISSLYAYNLARVRLARATGSAERSISQYWKGK